MKSFKEYQELAGVTRKLEETPLEFGHYALGMIGEAGELASPVRMSLEDYTKELGDCFWYAAGVCSVYEIDFEGIFVNSDLSELTTSNVINVLLVSAANLCEIAKKFLFYGREPSVHMVRELLVDYVSCLLFLCRTSGLDPLEVCAKNIAKLEARFGGKFDAYRANHRNLEAEAAAVAGVSQ